MRGGGTERVVANLCNNLTERSYDVYLAFNTNKEIAYQLNGKIKIINSAIRGSKNRMVRVYRAIRKRRCIINQIKPDVVIAFSNRPTKLLLSTLGLHIPVIISYRTTFDREMSTHAWLEAFYGCRMAKKLTIMTEHDYRFLGKRFPQKVVMYNPLSYKIFQGSNQRKKNILCVGGMQSWRIKGFDTIIKVWGEISPLFDDWILEIVTGLQEEDLEYLLDLAKACNVERTTKFTGFRNDIDKVMQESSVFVLPSKFEGMPNTLLEAMSQGCCCIAFDCKTGPGEIITNNASGILVKDQDMNEMGKALVRVMNDEALRERFSVNAREEVKRFNLDAIVDKWEVLFDEVLKENNKNENSNTSQQ
jgi:glycosyltransferase involved in cell wall biosynthesis